MQFSTLLLPSAAYLMSLSFAQEESSEQLRKQEEEEIIPLCNSDLCSLDKLGDGVCNPECLSADCNYDLGDCCINVEECQKSLISNGVCEVGCKVSECAFDWDDCFGEEDIDNSLFAFCALELPSYIDLFPCTFDDLSTGPCNEECEISACNFDFRDCDSSVAGTVGIVIGSICVVICVCLLIASGK